MADEKNHTSTDPIPQNSADQWAPVVAAAISNPVSARPLVATVDVSDLSDPAAQQLLAAAIQSQIVDAIPEELS